MRASKYLFIMLNYNENCLCEKNYPAQQKSFEFGLRVAELKKDSRDMQAFSVLPSYKSSLVCFLFWFHKKFDVFANFFLSASNSSENF